MKFVAGLVGGTLITLLLAAGAGFEWDDPRRLQGAAPTQSVERFAATLTGSAEDTEASSPSATQSKTIQSRSLQPKPAPIQSVTIAPLPADPVPAPSPELNRPATQPALATRDGKEAIRRPRVVSAQTAPVTAPAKIASATGETAVIWKPFHSEVSANGFARRLSTQLGYPFRALKEGPGKYHVVFDYGSDQQRELLQQQVSALTGFSAF